PALAEWLLDPATSVQTITAHSAIRADLSADPPPTGAEMCWAQWGHPDKARAVAERIYACERALGWYGPAGRIAKLATLVDSFDPQWARQLADEGATLIENAATGKRTLRKEADQQHPRRGSHGIPRLVAGERPAGSTPRERPRDISHRLGSHCRAHE